MNQRNQSGSQYSGSPSGMSEFYKWARELEGWTSMHPTSEKPVHVVTKKSYDQLKTHAEWLAEALRKIAEREWDGEQKSWRTEAIEMQDEARETLAQWEGVQK